MRDTLKVTIDRRNELGVVCTEGPINKEESTGITRAAYQLIEEGQKVLLLNLSGTKIINSRGILFLIEIIEKILKIDGRLGFCCVTPTIEKTFNIVGLTQYARMYPDEESAVTDLTRK